jgi:hypothetical protein
MRLSGLQVLKPLKKTEFYVVPKGTTHKPYSFFGGLLGHRVSSR